MRCLLSILVAEVVWFRASRMASDNQHSS